MKQKHYLNVLVILLAVIIVSFAGQVLALMGKIKTGATVWLFVIIGVGLIFYGLKKIAEKEPWFGKPIKKK